MVYRYLHSFLANNFTGLSFNLDYAMIHRNIFIGPIQNNALR